MEAELIESSLVLHPLYQEMLRSLLQERDKVEKDINVLIKKLRVFSSGVDYIERQYSLMMEPIFCKLRDTYQALEKDLTTLRQKKELTKKEKKYINEVLKHTRDLSQSDSKPESDNDNDSSGDISAKESHLPPPEQESFSAQLETDDSSRVSGTLRKLFLDLSKEFHPDRAANEEECTLFTSRMAHINSLYKIGDMAALHLYSLEIKSSQNSFSSSSYNEEIEKCTADIDDLKRTFRQLKKIYRDMRASVPSAPLVDKAIKGKADLEKEFDDEVKGLGSAREMLTELHQCVVDIIENKKPFDCLNTMIESQSSKFVRLDQDDLEEMLRLFVEEQFKGQKKQSNNTRTRVRTKRGTR